MPVQQTTETQETPRARVRGGAATTELSVTGMTCGNCARHVTEALQGVPGVHSANVSLDSRQASVRWSPGSTQNPSGLVQAVEKAGFDAKVIQERETASDAGERKLAGWQLNLWLGVLGTLPL